MKLFFLILPAFILFGGCQRDQVAQKKEKPSPQDEGEKFAKTIYGENVNILLRGDMNANGKPDMLAAVINKQLAEMKFWTQRGGVIEKEDDGWKLILRIDDRVSSTKGDLQPIPPSRTGYILSFSMEQNPVNPHLAASDFRGNTASEEFVLKWDELNRTYEVVK
jgi:hypothetical protein